MNNAPELLKALLMLENSSDTLPLDASEWIAEWHPRLCLEPECCMQKDLESNLIWNIFPQIARLKMETLMFYTVDFVQHHFGTFKFEIWIMHALSTEKNITWWKDGKAFRHHFNMIWISYHFILSRMLEFIVLRD